MTIALIGALFLGAFVGYVLGLVIKTINSPTVQNAVAIVGAAVTGAPVLFLEELGPEKWLYPVGLVAGIFWSRFSDIARSVSRGPTKQGRFAWWMSIVQALGILSASGLGLYLAASGNSIVGSGSDTPPRSKMLGSKMPCRLAWVFLGRYSDARGGYEVPPGFRYADSESIRSPIPQAGDVIVMTADRNLIVTGYGLADRSRRCDRMLDPPAGYRPETATEYQAGKIQSGTTVLVNQISALPSREAAPAYIWALVGPP